MIASLVPDTVTALSVELGSISDATTTEAPLISHISFIFEPPLPIREPHWDAGIIKWRVIGGLGIAIPANGPPTFLKKPIQKRKIETEFKSSCVN